MLPRPTERLSRRVHPGKLGLDLFDVVFLRLFLPPSPSESSLRASGVFCLGGAAGQPEHLARSRLAWYSGNVWPSLGREEVGVVFVVRHEDAHSYMCESWKRKARL